MLWSKPNPINLRPDERYILKMLNEMACPVGYDTLCLALEFEGWRPPRLTAFAELACLGLIDYSMPSTRTRCGKYRLTRDGEIAAAALSNYSA